MKRIPILVFGVALAVLAATPAQAATTARKGISTISFGAASQDIKDVGASWYYNWASGTGNVAKPANSEFVPMIWGAANVNSKDLTQAKQQGKQLLAFNEPNLKGQAEMSVAKALELWPQLQNTGLRLGAPAVAFGGDQAGGWLDQFMSGATSKGYRVDFIPLHWYGSDFSSKATGQLHGYLQAVYNRYHKPIWLTEYALINFSSGHEVCPSSQQQVDFVKASTAMLEKLSFLERYAWFTLSTDGHCSGLYSGSTPTATGQAYRAVG